MASIKDLNRMCIMQTSCINCPLQSKDFTCLPDSLPDDADEIVDKWVEEHKPKTYLADFKKKFPNARINNNGIPSMCVHFMYGDDTCECCWDCNKCWRKEMPERVIG